jgi:RNA polymerase sigma factor (sigma-70 family)
MSALRSLRGSEQEILFRPWIHEIAKNACIDHLRRARRAQEVSIDSDDFSSQEESRLSRDMAGTDAAVARRGELESLRMAFNDLPRSQHQILVMRELEGLSYDKIGNRMGLTHGAVESLLFRARRRLRDGFDEIDTGERCVSMRTAMDAVAEGSSRARERRRLSIHLQDCKACRRHAVAMGLDSLGAEQVRAGRLQRAILFLPLPAFLRRRLDETAGLGPAAQAGVEQGATLAGKATAVVVAAVLAAGGAGVTHKATGGDLPLIGGSAPATGETRSGSDGGAGSASGEATQGGAKGAPGLGTRGSSSLGGPGAGAGGGPGQGAAGKPGAPGASPLSGDGRTRLPGALGDAVGGGNAPGEAGRGAQTLQGAVGGVEDTAESLGSAVGVSPGRTVDNVARGDVEGVVNDVGDAVRELPGRVLPGGGSGSNSPESGSGSGSVSVPEVRVPAPSVQLPRVGGTTLPGTSLQVPDTGLGL